MTKVLEIICDRICTLSVKGDIDGCLSAYCDRVRTAEAAVPTNSAPTNVEYRFSNNGRLGASVPTSDGLTVKIWDGNELRDVESEKEGAFQVKALPVFFEKRYHFRLSIDKEIRDEVKDVSVAHPLKSVATSFDYEDGILSGSLDFVNSPGKFRLPIEIKKKDGLVIHLVLDVTVVSTKMDVERDYNAILMRIEREKKHLVYAFLSKTTGSSGIKPEIVKNNSSWQYQIFDYVFDQFKSACQKVIYSPHMKDVACVAYRRADGVRHWTPSLAREFYEADKDRRARMYFRTETRVREIDTPENRFVLHTLRELKKLLAKVQENVKENDLASDVFKKHIDDEKCVIERLVRNPFFARVGAFTGFRASSLVLQKRAGYARIYAIYLAMRRALTVAGDDINLAFRSIASLYEFWCFLTVRDLIQDIRKVTPVDVTDIENIDEFVDDDGQKLCKMVSTFNCSDIDADIELSYQKNYGPNESDDNTFASLYDQRPDIVMSIKEKSSGAVYTYLFDAKYRLREEKDKDCAPRETLDDMHRYRDAILYREGVKGIKHEVIGAYVLYPGRAKPKSLDYKEIIDRENIGAIELLPGEEGTASLKKFLKTVLNKHGDDEHLKEAIAPRGARIQLQSDVEKNILVVREMEPSKKRIVNKSENKYEFIAELLKDDKLPQIAKYVVSIDSNGFSKVLYRVVSATTKEMTEKSKKVKRLIYQLAEERRYTEDTSLLVNESDGNMISSDMLD